MSSIAAMTSPVSTGKCSITSLGSAKLCVFAILRACRRSTFIQVHNMFDDRSMNKQSAALGCLVLYLLMTCSDQQRLPHSNNVEEFCVINAFDVSNWNMYDWYQYQSQVCMSCSFSSSELLWNVLISFSLLTAYCFERHFTLAIYWFALDKKKKKKKKE